MVGSCLTKEGKEIMEKSIEEWKKDKKIKKLKREKERGKININ